MGKKNTSILTPAELATLAVLLGKLVGSAGDASTDGVAADADAASEGGDDLTGEGEGSDDLTGEGEAESEPAGPTVDECRDALKAVIKARGREIAEKLLAKYGVKKVDALDEEKFAEFIEYAGKVAKNTKK